MKVRTYEAHVAHIKEGCKQDKFICQICMKFEGTRFQKDAHMTKCIKEIRSLQAQFQAKSASFEQKILDLETKLKESEAMQNQLKTRINNLMVQNSNLQENLR